MRQVYILTCDKDEASAKHVIIAASGTLSRLGAGMLADYVSPFQVAAVSLSLASLTVFLLWGLASTNFGALVAFSAVFGLVATGFTSLATGVIKDLAGACRHLSSSCRS